MLVFEFATRETFFARGYLAANPDLTKAFGPDEAAATRHFESFGCREGRRQISQSFFEWRDDVQAQRNRFLKFKHCLVNVPPSADRFPIRMGMQAEDVQTYAGESKNAHPSVFTNELRSNPGGIYADIGAGLRDEVAENCVYVEVYPSLTTDVVVDPTSRRLPFATGSLDGLGCFAVLEHVRQPWTLCLEIARVVKPGGKIFVDWPFLQPVHGFPSHYYNATHRGLAALFEADFDITLLKALPHQGPDRAIRWMLHWFLLSIKEDVARNEFSNLTIGQIVAEPLDSPVWKRVLESVSDDDRSTLACGNFLIGRRKPRSSRLKSLLDWLGLARS